MSIINYTIERDSFEKVLDAIGAILAIEIDTQKQLQPDVLDEDYIVLQESSNPYNINQEVSINVWFDNSSFGTKSQSDSQASVTYNIDIYARSIEEEGTDGSEVSARKIHKYLRFCRHILSFTGYNTLGEDFIGLIGGTEVSNIEMLDPKESNEAGFVRFGRLTFVVRMVEGQELWKGVAFSRLDTEVKLENTELGYKYILINS